MYYRFSEDPHIEEFHPEKNKEYPKLKPAVWAIDEDHGVEHFFPADCPRIILSKSKHHPQEEEKIFFKTVAADKIIAIESAWLEKWLDTKLYAYVLEEDGFHPKDEIAGYYVHYSTVKPVLVEEITHPLVRIADKGIELRITPDLQPLKEKILRSTLTNYSFINI